VIVDQALYRDGIRVAANGDLHGLRDAARAEPGLAWIGVHEPTERELARVAEAFALHPLAVEDAVKAHQRAKIERYGDTVFLVLRPARYVPGPERVELGELHVFAGPRFLVTVRHGDVPDLRPVRRRLEQDPRLLALGAEAVLYAIADRVVDDYLPVVQELERDIDELESAVFGGTADASRRVYALSRQVIELGRAVAPLPAIVDRLIAEEPDLDPEHELHEDIQTYLRDVQDHALRVQEQVAGFRELLQNILSVNLTLETKALSEASIRQNEEVKKISAWAAIIFAPTLVGTVYGMNFEHMPELGWTLGYPFALALMAAIAVGLFATFKRRGWI
jgi:magnesium transporter